MELARIEPKLELTGLAHPIDPTWKCAAFRPARQKGAAGIHEVKARRTRPLDLRECQ